MKKLSLEDIRRLRKNENDRVRRANKKFAEASKAERRVIVAKDILTQLATGKIKAKNGTYLDSSYLEDLLNEVEVDWGSTPFEKKEAKIAGETQLCDALRTMKSCDACALGSVFVSSVGFMDKLKLKDMTGGGFADDALMRRYLSKLFTKRQLHMIENAFEGHSVNALYKSGHGEDCRCSDPDYGCGGEDEVLQARCANFNDGARGRKALESIMHNIIDNKGTFKP